VRTRVCSWYCLLLGIVSVHVSLPYVALQAAINVCILVYLKELYQASYPMGTRGSFPGGKAAGP
jgi:hypothetical protein